MATEDLDWERSKISSQDMNLLKKLGFAKKKDALRFPHEESYPSPPMEYRVSFVDHLIRGCSPPIHEFLRGLLFVYGLQLHQLTPNSILHVSIFIILPKNQSARKNPEKSRKFYFTGRLTEPNKAEEAQGLLTIGRRGRGVVTPPYGVGPSGLLRLRLFAYLRVPDLNFNTNKPRYEKSSRAAAIAKPRSGGQSLCSTRPDGEVPRKASPSTPLPSPPPSSSPLLP
ncbi:hypothetical protein QYE76_047810 [Lolium multiflorum]|uniref:Transposase (putative) gypsy type domain-containing protein n=1 Tax=Lolium multiflorum TaxID=4521 RepID=A0AAD8TSG4_LOLMU|nr:hypothetical protein QYE76_047810 [Lolium multiflorum]